MDANISEDEFNNMMGSPYIKDKKEFDKTPKGVDNLIKARTMMMQHMAAAFIQHMGVTPDKVRLVQEIVGTKVYIYFEVIKDG